MRRDPTLSAPSRRGRNAAIAAATLCLVGVSGCGWDYRDSLGLRAEGPDASKVLLNRPLELPSQVPDDVNQLPTPQPGATSRVAPRPLDDAQIVLQGGTSGGGATSSAGEDALLAAAGASETDAAVRAEIAAEAKDDEENSRLLDSLISSSEDEEALDPASEARRLAQEARQSKNPDLEVPKAE